MRFSTNSIQGKPIRERVLMDPKQHRDKIYRTKRPTEVSWYLPHLEKSLELIAEVAPRRDTSIIDVGAGESTLVDDLLGLALLGPPRTGRSNAPRAG